MKAEILFNPATGRYSYRLIEHVRNGHEVPDTHDRGSFKTQEKAEHAARITLEWERSRAGATEVIGIVE